jgi:hypothetical protein
MDTLFSRHRREGNAQGGLVAQIMEQNRRCFEHLNQLGAESNPLTHQNLGGFRAYPAHQFSTGFGQFPPVRVPGHKPLVGEALKAAQYGGAWQVRIVGNGADRPAPPSLQKAAENQPCRGINAERAMGCLNAKYPLQNLSLPQCLTRHGTLLISRVFGKKRRGTDVPPFPPQRVHRDTLRKGYQDNQTGQSRGEYFKNSFGSSFFRKG